MPKNRWHRYRLSPQLLVRLAVSSPGVPGVLKVSSATKTQTASSFRAARRTRDGSDEERFKVEFTLPFPEGRGCPKLMCASYIAASNNKSRSWFFSLLRSLASEAWR